MPLKITSGIVLTLLALNGATSEHVADRSELIIQENSAPFSTTRADAPHISGDHIEFLPALLVGAVVKGMNPDANKNMPAVEVGRDALHRAVKSSFEVLVGFPIAIGYDFSPPYGIKRNLPERLERYRGLGEMFFDTLTNKAQLREKKSQIPLRNVDSKTTHLKTQLLHRKDVRKKNHKEKMPLYDSHSSKRKQIVKPKLPRDEDSIEPDEL